MTPNPPPDKTALELFQKHTVHSKINYESDSQKGRREYTLEMSEAEYQEFARALSPATSKGVDVEALKLYEQT